MKKIIAIILTLAMALSLAACTEPAGGNDDTGKTTSIVSNDDGTTSGNGDTSSNADDTSSDADDTSSDAGNTFSKADDKDDDKDKEDGKDDDNKVEEPITDGRFFNTSLEGRWHQGNIDVLPAEVYFDGRKLVFTCFLVNGMDHARKDVKITHLKVKDAKGVTIIDCDVTPNGQSFTLPSLEYITHTYTFSGDILLHTDVDLSGLSVSAQLYSNPQ